MSSKYLSINNLKVSEELFSFVNDDLLKDSGITSEKFWSGFYEAIHELAPRNKELIIIRENLQKKSMNGILRIKEAKLKSMNIKIF